MKNIFPLFVIILVSLGTVTAQTHKGGLLKKKTKHPAVNLAVPTFTDSLIVPAHPAYDKVSAAHRWLFGENYRKDWALPAKLPVIRLSSFQGGLKPVKQGGGMESKSLRLVDSGGQEWVLRSVEKIPDKLLPENLQGTFAVDWVGDEFSGQHPYSALVVPPLAQAARVPHANPVIGIIADDPALGTYRYTFAGTLCLLEEREPAGSSENTANFEKALVSASDNRFDGDLFLRARMLDLLLGDWDRHEDQWRWAVSKAGKTKFFKAVPRDRDQVFHVTQGLFPSIAALPWLDPVLDNFSGDIPRVKYSLFKTRFIKAFPDAQISYAHWKKVVAEFVNAENDEVLEAGLRRLPEEIYTLRHKELMRKLQQRRAHIPVAMDEYYRFINRIVDIRMTDQSEMVTITDDSSKFIRVHITKIAKNGELTNVLLDHSYDPGITREIRLYLQGGNDQVRLDTRISAIKLRVIDSSGKMSVDVKESYRKLQVYGSRDSSVFTGRVKRLNTHLNNNVANMRFVPANPYNIWAPLATGMINADDGLLLGLGFRYTGHDGFRQLPYSNLQELMLTHSFSTDAFRLRYNGEWIGAFGTADLTVQANIQAPDNTMNFFGRGNETKLDKTGDYHRYYRARFDTYDLNPSMRWHTGKGSTLSVGPAIQYYHYDAADNNGRLVTRQELINSYDAATISNDKIHAGLVMNYISNQRNNNVLPDKGYNFSLKAEGFKGVNSYSRSYAQLRSEFTWYQKLDSAGTFVLSDRIGGGISVGSPAFYQSMFLGGQGNLLGYLQNRFAGQDILFNNLQGRLKLADIAGYILPGQIGLTAFYDVGRVWIANERSDKWHQGTGGGVYFSPASLTVLQVLAGHSEEGWYPYISLNFRL